jgi:hypothetical protein
MIDLEIGDHVALPSGKVARVDGFSADGVVELTYLDRRGFALRGRDHQLAMRSSQLKLYRRRYLVLDDPHGGD